jgi:hypothetical protein
MRFVFFLCLCISSISVSAMGINHYGRTRQDTTVIQKSSAHISAKDSLQKKAANIGGLNKSVVKSVRISSFPGVSLQQYLKGQAAGVTIQEPSGEPEQNSIFLYMVLLFHSFRRKIFLHRNL